MGEKSDTDVIEAYTVGEGKMVVFLSSNSVNSGSIGIAGVGFSESNK